MTSRHPILESAGSFADVVQPSAPPQYSLAEDFPNAHYNTCIVNTDARKDPPPLYEVAQDQDQDLDSDDSFDDDEFDSGPVYADLDGDDMNDVAVVKTGLSTRAPANYFVLEPEAIYENSDEPIYDVTPDEAYELEKVTGSGDVHANASEVTSRQDPATTSEASPPAYSLAAALGGLDDDNLYEPASAEDYVNQSAVGTTSVPPALPPRNDVSKGLAVQQDDVYENTDSSHPDQHRAQSCHNTSSGQTQNRDNARQVPRSDTSSYDHTRAPVHGAGRNPHMYSRLGAVTPEGEDLAYDRTASARPDAIAPEYEDVAIADPDDSIYSHLDDTSASFA